MDYSNLKKYSKIYNTISYVFPLLYILLIITRVNARGVFLLLLPLLNLLLLLIAIPFMEEKERSKSVFIYEISIALLLIYLPVKLSSVLKTATGKPMPIFVTLILDLIIALLCYMVYRKTKNKVRDIVEKICDTVFANKSAASDEADYSVILCEDEETGEQVVLDADARYVHCFVDGPTGCGKTSLALIPMLYQDVSKGHGVICIEPKGDLAEKVYAMCSLVGRPGIYFDPISPDCPCFNPLAGKEEDVIETITTVFVMLTPDSKTYFKDITTNLLRKSLMTLKRIEAAYTDYSTGISSRPATLIELNDLICNTNGRGVQLVNELVQLPTISVAEQKQNQDTKEWFMNDYFADRSKIYENASGVRTQVANLIQNKYLRRVLNPANGVSDIDFDKILQNEECISISTALGTLRELGSYLGYFLIFNLQSSIFKRPGNENTRKPCFLYIDEAQKYLNPGFADILTMARSFRVCVILASQSREQLVENAGDKSKAFLSNISANLRNLILFPGLCYEDADYYSKALGLVIKEEVRTGESDPKFTLSASLSGNIRGGTVSKQYSEVERAEFSSSDLTYKKFNYITYRILKNKSVQRARPGIVKWISSELNDKLEVIVENYKAEQTAKLQQAEHEESLQRQKLYEDFQRNMAGNNPAWDGQGNSPAGQRKDLSQYY